MTGLWRRKADSGRVESRRAAAKKSSASGTPATGPAPARASARASGVLALLLAGAGPLAAQGYTITDLGTMGGVSSEAWRINNRGQVIGSITLTPDRLTFHAFLWQDGVVTDLGSLGGSQTSA